MEEKRIGVQEEQGTFMGLGGNGIHYYRWLPEEEPKAALIVVHGLAEHSGRYGNLVDYFVPRGYAVYALDHVGHGRSSGRRGFVNSFEDFINGLKTFRDMVGRWQSGKPLFMVGHSMGGLIVAEYLIAYSRDVAGAVLSAPAVKIPDDVSSFTITLGRILSRIMPRMGMIKLDAAAISRDSQVVAEYEHDSLVYRGRVSARLASEILDAMERVSSEAGRITTPILIMQGGDDRLVAPDGATMLHEKAASEDSTLKVYDGLYHEIFNEPERDQVFNDMEEWISKRLSA